MKFIYPTGQYEKIVHKDKPGGYAGLDSNKMIKLDEIVAWLEVLS